MAPQLDVVLPYVDSTDPAWQDTFLATRHRKFTTDKARKLFIKLFSNRFASYGMFRYWWRAYEQFGPPGKVHLLLQTPSQIPEWLNTNHPRLIIHYHSDFMPKEAMPSYNSSCIELCFLQKYAANLTNFFLMMNDDFYFNMPTAYSNFVDGDAPLTWIKIKTGGYSPVNVFRSIICNNFKLVSKIAGKSCPHYQHGHLAICYKRDAIIPALNMFWPTISRTLTKFREASNYNHWILRYWQDFTGVSKHSPDFPHEGYLEMPKISSKDLEKIKNAKVVCFNDTNGHFNPDVKKYLEAKFPQRSSFEVG